MPSQPQRHAISPRRGEDFAAWYQQVIKSADLAEHALSRGCMVIKPWGYGVWQQVQRQLDERFEATGHENAYFPLLIPLSLLAKEASHIEGFAKECAVVTHSRLVSEQNTLKPSSPLEEPYIIRPTSEAIIGETYARWVQSYRDLPLLINQWANVVRWEMRTRLFLRTSEFLWQEGHTVHATAQEAQEETLTLINLYKEFAQQHLAMPVIVGTKTPDERFPGAEETYTIEALMQDGKALQAGTSHFLGQNFSRAYQIRFQNREGVEEYAWTTSWGVSTRLIGAVIMTHSDDDGLILPPRIAPKHIVIQPILKQNQTGAEQTLAYVHKLAEDLKALSFHGEPLRVVVDDSEQRPGEKNWKHIKRGVPLRLQVGPKEVEQDQLSWWLRHEAPTEKHQASRQHFLSRVTELLTEMQQSLFSRAQQRLNAHTHNFCRLDEYRDFLAKGGMGLVRLPWCPHAVGHSFCKEWSITPRCIPLHSRGSLEDQSTCAFTGRQATANVLFAKAY